MSTNVTSTQSPPSIEPPMSASNPSLSSPGMNYFFGFLIAFIALLLFFIGCGVGARRSLMRSRRLQQRLELEEAEAAAAEGALFGDLEGLVVMRKNENVNVPVFWDRWVGGEQKEWGSMMPLGAMVVPNEVPPPSATPNWLRPRTPERRSWRRSIQAMMPFTSRPPPQVGDGVAIPLHSLSHSPPTTTSPEENNTRPPPSDPIKQPLQVMVMIAMPSKEKEQRIPHVQFGITRVLVLCDNDESML